MSGSGVELKISEMPAVSSVAGSELLELVQGGQNRRATVDQILRIGSAVAAQVHSHAIADVSGLSTALDAKAPKGAATAAGLTVSAQARLLGRWSSGTGALEEVRLGAGLTLTGDLLEAAGGGAGVTSIGGLDGVVSSEDLAGLFGGGALLYPAAGAMARTVVEYAFRQRMLGPDGAEQVRVEATPAAVEYWRMGGAIAGAGPFMMAWSDSQADVPAVFGAKGKGSVILANGAGPMLEAMEGGVNKQVDAPLQVRGGSRDYVTHPGIYVPSQRRLWMGVDGKRILEVRADVLGAGDAVALAIAATADTAKLVAEGTATNVSMYQEVKGAGSFTFGNAAGNFLLLLPPSSGAAANYLTMRAGQSGTSPELGVFPLNDVPLRIMPFGRADMAGGLVMGGYAFRFSGTGFANFTLLSTQSGVHWHDGSTISTAAVTLPNAPSPGQIMEFSSSAAITTLTVTPAAGHTVVGAPTSLTAGVGFRLKFIANSVNAWVRV